MRKDIIRFVGAMFIVLLTFVTCSCSGNKLEKVNFSLIDYSFFNEYPEVTLIKNEDEFISFLNDKSIFKEELSESFKEVNKKYDAEFFENNYLCALIILASSGSIEGYKVKKVEIKIQEAIIYIKTIAPKNVTDDMGGYFTYYLTIEKCDINTASITYQ